MILTRSQMIEFIATVDAKPVEHITVLLSNLKTDAIEPIVETMINESMENMRENIAIAV